MADNSTTDDDPTLLDGTYPVRLSLATQEKFECVAEKDLHPLEPQKSVAIEAINRDLDENGDESDFAPLVEHIKETRLIEPLLIFDPTRQHGLGSGGGPGAADFLLCLNQDSKFGYLTAEEDSSLRLIEKTDKFTYRPPEPREWSGMGSEKDVEGTWVKDTRSRIHLQIRRKVARKNSAVVFSDRDVKDAKDGYVSCESYVDKKKFSHLNLMDRAVQAVPTVVEGESQTDLKHPKHVAIQYEARVFGPEEVEQIWTSRPMINFLTKADKIVSEVTENPDIMGDFRAEIESFFRRDEVVAVEERSFVHRVFFSDLVFSQETRVTCVRWHPTIPGIVAMAVTENVTYEEHLDRLSRRLAMPTLVMIWSMSYPFFPQILLRAPEDVKIFDWHPLEASIMVGGCTSGQLVIWDISSHVDYLKRNECTWDHKVFLSPPTDRLHIQEGYVPVLYWSAESDKEHSHLNGVEFLQWLPKNVWFSHDSAYPKQNQFERQIQLISCGGDKTVLIWALKRPHSDDGVDDETSLASTEVTMKATPPPGLGWAKLKLQSAVPAHVSRPGAKKYSPAVGKYEYLNKIWRPVHRICFLDPTIIKNDKELFKVVITSLNVVSRPELMHGVATRKDSIGEEKEPAQKATGKKEKSKGKDKDGGEKRDKPKSKEEGRQAQIEGKKDQDRKQQTEDLEDSDEKEKEEIDPAQFALPTFLTAGTIFGSVFRVDLTKVRVDVETNDLICKVDWDVSVHDGPVTAIVPSPFVKHLTLTVGGYSWALWKEDRDITTPVVLHYADESLFTSVAWSLSQPSVIFFSDETGKMQAWDITSKKSEPFQTQDISGRTINVIAPYEYSNNDNENDGHYISIADETGTLHVMTVPEHLEKSTQEDLAAVQEFIEDEIIKKLELERLQDERKERLQEAAKPSARKKRTDREEFDLERRVDWYSGDYFKGYFSREKGVMFGTYGEDWMEQLRHQDLPRKQYHMEEKRRHGEDERKRQQLATAKTQKKKGGSIFRKND